MGKTRSKVEKHILTRRNVIRSAAHLGAGSLLAGSSLTAIASSHTDQKPFTKAPSLKRPRSTFPRWTQLADMPFPVQEVYPAPFHSNTLGGITTPKALARQRFNVLVSAGGIVGVKGSQIQATQKTFVYDPISDAWRKGPDLPQAWHHLHLVAHNGFLFALGGYTIEGTKKNPNAYSWVMRQDVLRLSDINQKWQSIGYLPAPQAESVSVSLNGFLHIVGGRSPSGSANELYTDHIDTDRHIALDTRRNEWIQLAPLSVARNSMAGVARNGTLYVFGGRRTNGENLNIAEAYDPVANRWHQLHPMPVANSGLSATVLDGSIYLFGGEKNGQYRTMEDLVWAYDIREDKWRDVGIMPRPRHGLGAVTINNAIYLIGGGNRQAGFAPTPTLDRFML